MKKCLLIAMLFASVCAFAQSRQVFGMIDFADGSASIIRASKVINNVDIGDTVFVDDMIKTSINGLIIINIDKTTGMNGTLTIKPNTALYVRVNTINQKTTVELLAGQIASKLNKVAGNPEFQVVNNAVVMGVRGTEFSILTSINNSVLVTCTEGSVICTSGSETVSLSSGRAAEKKGFSGLRVLPGAIASVQRFEETWIRDEIEAFKANPAQAIGDYNNRYTILLNRFEKAMVSLKRSRVLAKWIREDNMGLVPRSTDPIVMAEKKEIIIDILAVKQVLFMFECVFYRLRQLEQYVSSNSLEKLDMGHTTTGDFFRRNFNRRNEIEGDLILFRYAEYLYKLRNTGFTDFLDDFYSTEYSILTPLEF